MTNKELLISHINLLSEEDIASLLDAVILMETKCTLALKPDCPYCGSHAIIHTGINVGNRDSSANPAQRLLFRLPIPLCQTPISRQGYGAKL